MSQQNFFWNYWYYSPGAKFLALVYSGGCRLRPSQFASILLCCVFPFLLSRTVEWIFLLIFVGGKTWEEGSWRERENKMCHGSLISLQDAPVTNIRSLRTTSRWCHCCTTRKPEVHNLLKSISYGSQTTGTIYTVFHDRSIWIHWIHTWEVT